MTYQGYIKNGVVVLDEPALFAEGTKVRVQAVSPATVDFWQCCSLDELASRQGVSAPRSFKELLGGWPKDELDDGFEDVVVHWRQGELEPYR